MPPLNPIAPDDPNPPLTNARIPPLIAVVPVNEFVPVNANVPPPNFKRPAEPPVSLTIPAIVTALPAATFTARKPPPSN